MRGDVTDYSASPDDLIDSRVSGLQIDHPLGKKVQSDHLFEDRVRSCLFLVACHVGCVGFDLSLGCIRPLLERVWTEIYAVEIDLKELWIFSLEVDWFLLSIRSRSVGCTEDSAVAVEYVGVDGEALRLLANNDFESFFEVVPFDVRAGNDEKVGLGTRILTRCVCASAVLAAVALVVAFAG